MTRPIACTSWKRFTYQPMVAKRINDPTLAQPVILVFNRRHLNGTRANGFRGDGIGVRDE